MPSKHQQSAYLEQFVPAQASGTPADLDVVLRLAHASEYAAAQLGAIARATERIEARLNLAKGPADLDAESAKANAEIEALLRGR